MFGISRLALIISAVSLGLVAIIWILAVLFRSAPAGTPMVKSDSQKVVICPRTTEIQNGIGKICVYNCEGELYRLDVLMRGCPDRLEF